jgi:hypothetical protein
MHKIKGRNLIDKKKRTNYFLFICFSYVIYIYIYMYIQGITAEIKQNSTEGSYERHHYKALKSNIS